MSEQWATFERVGTVIAVQLTQPLEWRTQGGALMRGEAGDWVITDPTGGPRTAKDANFRATHVRAHGDRWRRVARVHARRAQPGETVNTQEGVLVAGEAAAWVVKDASGAEWIVPEEHFQRTYRPWRDAFEPGPRPSSPTEGLE